MNKRSQQHLVGAVLIMVLMIGVSVSTGFKVSQDTVEAGDIVFETADYETQAYSDYVYHKEITIESDYVDTSLANFPILVHDNTGDLSDILANGSDIAFFNETKETQFNHEIELYNSGTGELWAWVNVTSISSSVDTVLYMYYDDSDGGYPVGHNPTDTWDSDFGTVQHMNSSTASIYDSTTNNNIGAKKGASEPAESTSGKMGSCQLFDAVDDVVTFGDAASIDMDTHDGTIEAWFKTSNEGESFIWMTQDGSGLHKVSLEKSSGGTLYGFIKGDVDKNDYHKACSPPLCNDSVWRYVAMTIDNANTDLRLFLNGTELSYCVNTTTWDGTTLGNSLSKYIGNYATASLPFDGSIDEFRFSSIERSDDWINTTFDSQNETTGFLTLGAQQDAGEGASVFTLKGVSSPYSITWSGTAGNTVYCNSSGDAYEWPEINMTINATDNVTEIRVWVGDLNNTGPTEYINASNITLYVANYTNASYYSFGTFTDGGSNISINITTWNTYIGIDNPFNDTGLTDTNTSIFFVLKLAIPATSSTDTFTSLSTTTFKIYIGHDV